MVTTSMVGAAVLSIFIEGAHFEAATGGSPKPAFERFENTASGVEKLARWLEEVLPQSTEQLDSCVAIDASAQKTAYESPVFEFVHDATRNTFVWSPAQLSEVPRSGEGNTAARMLAKCIKQHARPR